MLEEQKRERLEREKSRLVIRSGRKDWGGIIWRGRGVLSGEGRIDGD